MAGRKPEPQEREKLRELFRQNYTVAEVMTRYPDLDGRSVAGIRQQIVLGLTSPEAGASLAPAPSPAAPAGEVPPQRVLEDPKSPQQLEAERLGFSPSSETVHGPSGFRPAYREYFVVKKLDQPNAGLLKHEYPPFGAVQLLARYGPGDYEIQHYKDGRLYNTYHEPISDKSREAGNPSAVAVVPEKRPVDDPGALFMKAIDVTHRLHMENKQEANQSRAIEAQAKSEEVKAKAQVETAATVGLIEILKEDRNKVVPKDSSVENLVTIMHQQQASYETRMKADMEAARDRHKQELETLKETARLEREREEARADRERQKAKDEAEEKIKREREFLAQMKEIEEKRQKVAEEAETHRQQRHEEAMQKIVDEMKETREAFNRELDEKKQWVDGLNNEKIRHTNEIIDLKKTLGTGDGIKIAEVVTQGFDRLGHRFDTLVNSGLLGNTPIQNPPPKPDASGAPPPPQDPAKEKPPVLTENEIMAELNKPWFKELKSEAIRTLEARANGMNLHGAMMGQIFLQNLNAGKVTVAHLHWVCSRRWPEVLQIAKDSITDEERKVLGTPDAAKWWGEMTWYLAESYNRSLAQITK
jgi:hypothetical protein